MIFYPQRIRYLKTQPQQKLPKWSFFITKQNTQKTLHSTPLDKKDTILLQQEKEKLKVFSILENCIDFYGKIYIKTKERTKKHLNTYVLDSITSKNGKNTHQLPNIHPIRNTCIPIFCLYYLFYKTAYRQSKICQSFK